MSRFASADFRNYAMKRLLLILFMLSLSAQSWAAAFTMHCTPTMKAGGHCNAPAMLQSSEAAGDAGSSNVVHNECSPCQHGQGAVLPVHALPPIARSASLPVATLLALKPSVASARPERPQWRRSLPIA